MEKEARILFMGTPDFAVASLGALLMNGYKIVGVVSSPDKKSGRGLNIKRSAVARYASENYLNLLQPDNLKDPLFIKEVNDLKPDIAIVVAFRMLPEEIWSIPTLGTFNLHASLLPQYRGAAPINHAIINGERVTGITTFLIDKKIDTGNILFRKKINISLSDSAGELHDRLMRSGAKLVVRTVKQLLAGKATPINQTEFMSPGESLRKAPKIFPENCFINWSASTLEVYNFIRGLSPYPGARTYIFNGKKNTLIKVLETRMDCNLPESEPGIITIEENRLKISCSDGSILIKTLHPEGKKAMISEDYLRGVDASALKIIKGPQV